MVAEPIGVSVEVDHHGSVQQASMAAAPVASRRISPQAPTQQTGNNTDHGANGEPAQ